MHGRFWCTSNTGPVCKFLMFGISLSMLLESRWAFSDVLDVGDAVQDVGPWHAEESETSSSSGKGSPYNRNW